MTLLRFLGYLIGGLLAPLAIIPLGIAWIILSLIVGTWDLWRRAKRAAVLRETEQ